MHVLIPLAGPDFERKDGRVKAEEPVQGLPLLRAALESRPWWQDGEVNDSTLVFVLRDTPISRTFAAGALRSWYPRGRCVFVGASTGGAALTALAGLALVAHDPAPLCIDLVDILYKAPSGVSRVFVDPSVGGAALVFPSNRPEYSYLRKDQDGRVVEVAEKKVISLDASAGTYFFASAGEYLRALAENLAHPAEVTYRDLFFVCPVFNGILARGREVVTIPVTDVHDIKMVGPEAPLGRPVALI